MGVLGMGIDDGATYFRSDQEAVIRGHPAWVRVAHLVPPANAPTADAPAAAARVNAGRWIADCPDCNGAEFVWLANPRLWCVGCRNAALGGAWRAVTVPSAEDRAAIEAALAVRANPAHRNWQEPETVENLLAENAAMGG